MSSQTTVELIESPSELAIETVLTSFHEGSLEAHLVTPDARSTRPNTPDSDPEIILNTPPHSPDPEAEQEDEPKLEPEALFAEETERTATGSQVVEKAHTEDYVQVSQEEIEGIESNTAGEILPTFEEVQIPKKSKKSKRKESKKEKKKKKVVEEPFDSESIPDPIEATGDLKRDEPLGPPSEEIEDNNQPKVEVFEGDPDIGPEIETNPVDLVTEESQEISIIQEEYFPQEEIQTVEVLEEPYQNPEEVDTRQAFDPDQDDIAITQDTVSVVKDFEQVSLDLDTPPEDIELLQDTEQVVEAPEKLELQEEVAFPVEESDYDHFQSSDIPEPQWELDTPLEAPEEASHNLSTTPENPEPEHFIVPATLIPEEPDPDTVIFDDDPVFDQDIEHVSQISADQQDSPSYELSHPAIVPEPFIEERLSVEPGTSIEALIPVYEKPVADEELTQEPETEKEVFVSEPEIAPDSNETESHTLIPEPNIDEDFIVAEQEAVHRKTECLIPDPAPEPRPLSEYASTVEESPEEVETPPPSVHSEIQMPENTADLTSNISTMALQDRSLIASQLSDALALFNSFDESVKSLVTRLQSNENNYMTKPEHEGSTPISSAPFHVPYTRNPNFHGRFSILSQIFGMWRPQQRCRIAVAGLGGLGKTELIVEFIYRARQISPNTPVFWFGPEDIRSKEQSTTAISGLQLEDWLRSHHDPGAMLIVDSGDRSDLYDTTSDRGSFVDRLRNFEGTVILLSRNSRDGNIIARPHEICEVRELELDACVNLMCDHLETYAHDASTEKEIQEVVKSLHCIPRAIIQVAKVINSTQMTVSQFYEMYSTGEAFQLRLFSRIDPYSKPDPDLSVVGRGVFDLRSFRKTHAEPSRLLYQIYYLGGRAVPCSLVSTDDPLDKILLMLTVRAHFMIDEDLSNQTFSIHPMVYLAMRKALGSKRPLSDESEMLEERKWYDEVVLAFAKHYPDANCETRAWWKECFAHLISGYNLHSDKLRIAIATIYHRESSFFKRKGIFSEALKMASLAKSVLPDPVPSECLTIVQDQVTLLDFLAKYREVHEMLRGLTMEVGHPGNLWKKSMMAKLEVADCANRYDSAIEIFRQVRTAGEAANADKLDLSNATDDLSMALMQKGKYLEAATECRKALAERSSRLGSSHTDTLSSCHNLAEILHKDGKFDESHRYIQEALRGRENILGLEHPETIHSKVLRARIQISKATTTAEFDEAETVLVYSMDRLSTKLSPFHPIVMTCKSEIARIMFARGKYETAEAMNQAVLAAREQGPWLEPATHPDTMTSRNQLADVIRMKDGSKAADNLSERCLTERTVVLTNGSLTGDDFHPDQLASLHHRAIILSGLGQHLAALQKIDLALLGRKAILGEHHPDYFISMTWKGEIMRAQLHRYQSERTQTLDTIENLHKQAYEGLSWILGSEHQSSLQCATHMALAKRERGNPASSEAEGLFRQIHCAYQHNMGDFHPETLKSKGRLAEAMRAASPRHHLEAKKLWRDSCGGLTRIYGFDAHVTANAYKGYEKFLRTYPDP